MMAHCKQRLEVGGARQLGGCGQHESCRVRLQAVVLFHRPVAASLLHSSALGCYTSQLVHSG